MKIQMVVTAVQNLVYFLNIYLDCEFLNLNCPQNWNPPWNLLPCVPNMKKCDITKQSVYLNLYNISKLYVLTWLIVTIIPFFVIIAWGWVLYKYSWFPVDLSIFTSLEFMTRVHKNCSDQCYYKWHLSHVICTLLSMTLWLILERHF